MQKQDKVSTAKFPVRWCVAAPLLAAAVAAAGCASGGSVPRPFPTPGTARTRPVPPPEEPAPGDARVSDPADPSEGAVPSSPLTAPTAESSVLDTALALLGTPYVNGGSTPDGFDCSGFTQWVFAQHGLPLPRDTRSQFAYGSKIDPDELQPGDLVFFKTAGRHVSHVAIAIDRDRFVHAPNSRGVVRVESMGQPYWNRRFLGARRVRPDAALDTH